jgi:hypothetical protein
MKPKTRKGMGDGNNPISAPSKNGNTVCSQDLIKNINLVN